MKKFIIGASAALIATVSMAASAEAGWKWNHGHNHGWKWKRGHHHGMSDMAARCTGDQVPDCPVIDALFQPRLR